MRMGSIRAGIIFAVIAIFVLLAAPPSGALRVEIRVGPDREPGIRLSGIGVAILETQQQIVPPTKGAVSYRGGPSDNQVSVVRGTNSSLEITDPYTLIVAVHAGSGAQNCTGGFGSAICAQGNFLTIAGEGGDDIINFETAPGYAPAFVNCGPGNDRVTASAGSMIDPSCEVVTYT